ncbi:DEAD/DEAH box helicase family protein [Staphylococcus hominis]|uniref:DEAD/DEAH box helicase family protein n=1 Tax=Staphylococcus hominis TaxID=1290 RepID=UPI001F586BC1|nr:DEAD/DEAH box helicase family protein [Staphylococcus hominis]MCI2842532.1 DEAD/DEAH box helicase family protein [Staphylococcus hominis]MCI2851309.1 DEAD/DEAH box helicase family protein [Staphylococcus hominis]MCI2857895.1 DEAD/DEAH box helicase family protein [Staphylococcus hominis]MDS3891673.1 DEAD/DEAH box helicase family protein [Staphylococcus hominis]
MSKKPKQLSLPLYEEVNQLNESLFNKQLAWQTPNYISSNMVHKFRYYQDIALRFFHYSQTSEIFEYRNINHVLFNMSTGSGKTDLMAGLILYLYREYGYQNFLFLVNTRGVLNKTIDNLTNQTSDKYLYTPQIEIDGKRIDIKQVEVFPKVQSKNTIYLKLETVQRVAADIYTQKENTMGEEDYAKDKTVILGDEAHHFSASTKSEKEQKQSWEKAISTILYANEDNLLLEFTATIDLDDKYVYEKYKDKVLYRYTLDRFIQDGYSKNVKRIQSNNKDNDNMLNAILLSEYRRRYALENYNVYMKPVIMFKSQRIDSSNEAYKQFNKLVDTLTVDSLRSFLDRQAPIASEDNSETLTLAYQYYLNHNDLSAVLREIKREMNPNRIINANDTTKSGILEKGNYEALNSLESPLNLYRVIFAVARLTEGWDVLNLFDIVRLSDHPKVKGTKATTMSEAQLIGRGARYYPFSLSNERSFKRRFNDDGKDSLIMETIHYHTINEPQYLKNLVNSLDEMNLPTGEDKKNPLLDVKVKNSFKKTSVWKYGKIYYNETVKVSDAYYDNLEKYGVNTTKDEKIHYSSVIKEVNYKAAEIYENFSDTYDIALTFDHRYLDKVMNRLSFYHFSNLKKYIPLLKSREDFLGENWLNIFNRTIYITLPRQFDIKSLTSNEKLKILEQYFIRVSKQIKSGYSKERGTGKFIGYPIKEYITNYRKRIPKYDTGKFMINEPQIVQRYECKEPFFVYDSAIINKTEKQLIDRIAHRVKELEEVYSDIYLIRMDENMHRESKKNNNLKLHQFGTFYEAKNLAGFQPDFILYLQNKEYFIQIFIEPKGKDIEDQQWKENLLLYINEHEAEIILEDTIENVKIKGVKFYTIDDKRDSIKQLGNIALGKDFKGLSIDN